MPLYPYRCGCGTTFDEIRSAKEAVGTAECPNCGSAALQDYQAKRIQPPIIEGELIGAYGHGTPENPFHEITEGPNKGMTVVPSKHALFDDAKRKNDKEGTGLEWTR